jgi:hypothetical protein
MPGVDGAAVGRGWQLLSLLAKSLPPVQCIPLIRAVLNPLYIVVATCFATIYSISPRG